MCPAMQRLTSVALRRSSPEGPTSLPLAQRDHLRRRLISLLDGRTPLAEFIAWVTTEVLISKSDSGRIAKLLNRASEGSLDPDALYIAFARILATMEEEEQA